MDHRSWRRRNKLPKPGLQLRLVGAFTGLCVLALSSQALVMGVALSALAGRMPSGGGHLANELPALLTRTFLSSCALLLPALLLIGILVTFRVAGALTGLERHLKAVVQGEATGPCRLRERDNLQDFCALMNEALECARAQGAEEERASNETRLAG